MKRIKKLLVIIVAVMLSFTLQFRTTLSRGMESGFSLTKFIKNIFITPAYAEWTWYWHRCPEDEGWYGGGYCDPYPSSTGCLDPFNDCSRS